MRIIIYLAIAVIAFSGCARKASEDDKVIATISSQPITLKQFNARVAKLPAYYKTLIDKNKKLYLDDIIIEQLFYEEAIRKGVNRDSEVVDLLNEAKRKIYISKYIQNEIDNNIKVTDMEVKEFYDSNKDDFKTPPLWRASHILVGSEEQAKSILEDLSKGGNFEELAKKNSIDATATRGGDVGFFRMGQLIPEFENACVKLSKGQTSGIIHTQFGYHIIKLTDKREPTAESYEKVREIIEGRLKKTKREEAMNKLILDLKSRYNVIVDKDVFQSSQIVAEDSGDPANAPKPGSSINTGTAQPKND
ncbi:MAG: peptidylprolyl isomerase [Candidatus Omnitrophica bacterium]|nr:peptidylprolyl isomerase [Candidatus Omnitrophota bacterium]